MIDWIMVLYIIQRYFWYDMGDSDISDQGDVTEHRWFNHETTKTGETTPAHVFSDESENRMSKRIYVTPRAGVVFQLFMGSRSWSH